MESPLTTAPVPTDDVTKIGDLAAEAGIRRVHVLAWRDLDAVGAGGSELHMHEVARRWAAAGLEIVMRTSEVAGGPSELRRDGYRTIRRGGQSLVFPRAIAAEFTRRHGTRDALVEVWNGMPFFTPVWSRGPRLVVLHHVQRDVWRMALPPGRAAFGDLVERRLAPPAYRRSRIATLSESSRRDIHQEMGLPLDRISVVPPGLDDGFLQPGRDPAPQPTVLVVGRLAPVKRIDLLMRAAARARVRVPELRLVVVGEGFDRPRLERQVAALGAADWIDLRGHVDADELIAAYRSAWVVASASLREGWGMALTEAGALGVPAVGTRVSGHVDVIKDGHTGLLVDDEDDLVAALVRLLLDDELRNRFGAAAARRAATLSWVSTATQLMRLLAEQAPARRR